MAANSWTLQSAQAALAEHHIKEVRTLALRTRFPRFLGKNGARGEHGYGEQFYAKQLITDQGARGWGLFRNHGQNPLAPDAALLGQNLSAVFGVANGTERAALPFDFALHDLAGCILDLPVFRMLRLAEPERGGGGFPGCYDGAIYMNDISPDGKPEGVRALIEACEADWAAGYRDFKVKVGRAGKWMLEKEGQERDAEVVRMVRRHFPQSRVMVDFNDACSVEQVMDFVDRTREVGIHWIEEPFREERSALLRLKEYLARVSPQTLIADGESRPDVEQLFSLAGEGLLDVLQMDVDSYGFTPWRALLPRLEACPAVGSPHAWGLKIKTHYSAHLALASSKIPVVEGVLDETEGVDFSSYTLRDGYLYPPEKPGFGMDLIWGETVQK